jgi:hypothetical protein
LVNPVANQPSPDYLPTSKLSRFKIADPQYILSVDPSSTVEEMQNVLWQGIGGHEILSVVRRDLVDGSNTDFGLISDLQKLFAEYSPKTILSLENSSSLYFNSFAIKFEKYLPPERLLQRLSENLINPIEIDDSGNIFIYVKDLKPSFQVEVQAITAQESFRDTIYGGDDD